jgi:hypothetical protein
VLNRVAFGNQACEGGIMTLIQGKRIAPRTARRGVWMLLVAVCLIGCHAQVIDLPPDPSPAVQQELMSRWNAVAKDVTVPFAGSTVRVDFLWTSYNQFPHPTFKGGSAEAYQGFADILVTFYGRDDNFAFLANNQLFRIPLRYVLSSNQNTRWTFEQLTDDFSSTAWAMISADTKQKLTDFATRIHMSP